jgi:hypothetical protein
VAGEPAARIALPDALEAFDADLLTEILRTTHPEAVVGRVETLEVMQGTAIKARLRLTYRAGGASLPSTMIFKAGFPPSAAPMEDIYAREVCFYRDLRRQIAVTAPKPFGWADDPARQMHVLLLEDLVARDAHFCRVTTPIDEPGVRAFLDLLARMHASTWNSPFGDDQGFAGLMEWLPLPPRPAGDYAWGQLEPDRWEYYQSLPRAQAVPRRYRDRAWMIDALQALNGLSLTGPRCFLHGDFHLGNLYFDADGAPGALDWQSYGNGHWSHDVTYFLVSALDIADRRRWERGLIAYYLNRLEHHGVDASPAYDEAVAAYRLQLVDGLFYWMTNPPEWQNEVNNTAVASRFAIAALDHDL